MVYYTQILSLIFCAAMLTMWGRRVWKSSRRIEPIVIRPLDKGEAS